MKFITVTSRNEVHQRQERLHDLPPEDQRDKKAISSSMLIDSRRVYMLML